MVTCETSAIMRRFASVIILSVALLLLWAAPGLAVQSRNVAVSKVSQTSAVLVVKADVASDVAIDYGSVPGTYSASTSSNGMIRHEIALNGLSPASTVYYRITIVDSADPGSSIVLPEKSFSTAGSPGQPFSFAVMGDNRPATNTTVPPAVWNTITGQIVSEGPDLTLHVGDLIYGVHSDTLDQNVAKWDGFFAVTTQLTSSVPMFTAIGNHEYVNYANSRAGYEQEFTLPVNNGADAATYGEHYYSFDYGDTHFIALSTEIPGQEGMVTGNQKAWLQQDLAATASRWTVVYMHRPLFSGVHPTDPWMDTGNAAGQQNKAELHSLFQQHGVDLVFEGHEHYYLRHQEDGIQYVITGGGGAPLHNLPYLVAGDIYGASTFEHVMVDETSDALKVTTIDTTGSPLETFSLGAPNLSLSHTRTYWASYSAYEAGDLSVDYAIGNNGPGDAAGVQIAYLTATNGVVPQFPGATAIGDLSVGQSASFTINYLVPQGTAVFRATTYVTCNDLGGTSYAFPGPAPTY